MGALPVRVVRICIVIGVVLATSPFSWAMEDARVLPAGRFRMGLGQAQTKAIQDEFDASGNQTSLLAPYQLKLDSQNLRTYDSGLGDLIEVLNSTGVHFDSSKMDSASRGISVDPEKPLLGDALDRGFLEIEGSGIRSVQILSLQYGVTDRLTAGFVVPIMKTRVNFTAKLSGVNTAEKIYDAFIVGNPELLGSFNQVPSALSLIGEGGIETLQQLLVARGYDRVEPSEDMGLGDIGFGGRWNWWKNSETPGWDSVLGSIQGSITAPTGRLALPSELAVFDRGYGAWDLALAQIWNYQPSRFLTLSTGWHFSQRLNSERLKRVRSSDGDLLPDASSEEVLQVNWGMKRWWTLGARVNPSDFLSFQAGFEWFEKDSDLYEGKGDSSQYAYLSEETEAVNRTAQVGVGLSSVSRFLSGGFPVPLDLSLTHFWNTGGINTLVNRYTMAELSLYF